MGRFLRGVASWFRQLLEVDWRFVKYAIVGPSPPRITYVAFFLALTSWAVPAIGLLVRNPVGALFLGILIFLCLLAVFLAFVDAPPLRWHFLSDDITASFRSNTMFTVTETIDIRAMRGPSKCSSISYPIADLRGDLEINVVSEKGVPLAEKTPGQAGPGYVLERLGREAGYPRGRITTSWSYGIRNVDLEHQPQRRANETGHLCETWVVPSVAFQRTYEMRWTW